MARSRKDIADRARAESLSYGEKVTDFKTPYNFQGVIGDVNTNTFTEGALNSSRRELNEKQLAYFHEFSRYNFRHGLEVRPGENGDEDPVVFGFDIVINTQTSPLFGSNGEASIGDFFAFGESKGIREIQSRQDLYNKFNNQFSKFFSRTDSSFRNVKSFYLKNIEGLEGLINQATAIHHSKKQFTEFGKDSENIKITMYEDNYLNAGYMAMLYNTMAYSKINGKQIIPENLLRFDMSIIVSEIRKFNKVLNSLESGLDVMNVVNDNISRYKYNLYDCQFNFDKMSHPDSVKNSETSVTDEFTFNIYYKFVTLEMEKFQLNVGESDTREYINNGNVQVNQRQNGDASSAPGLTDLPYRTNDTDYMRFDQSGEVGNNVNTFYKPPAEDNIEDDGSGNTVPEGQQTSEIDDLKAQEAQRNSGTRDNVQTVEEEQQQTAEEGGIPLEPLFSGEFLPNYREAYPNGYNILEGDDVDEAEPKTGIAAIIDETKEFAMARAKQARDRLLNNTLQKIRTSTGLRRIGSPTNVYNDPNTLGFVEGVGSFAVNQIRDFANTELTGFIQQSPFGNLPVNDIKTLNLEYNRRIHDGEGGGGISDFDNGDTIL
jgi:hypothetical protein